MDTTSTSAPGKVILFGEHAVVYGRPAIAIPVTEVRATAEVRTIDGDDHILVAPDLNTTTPLSRAPADDGLAKAARQALGRGGIGDSVSKLEIKVTSTIPIASGLGSGAAVSAAVIRGIALHCGISASPAWVSEAVYEVERIYHGTPSGIDNSVVCHELPIVFQRKEGEPSIEFFSSGCTLTLLIADTGCRSETKAVVGDVRDRWTADTEKFERIFDECGRIATEARAALESGDLAALGPLMDANHAVLQEMTVSSPELDGLVEAARRAGARGAKLSGAGRGGNMIALVDADKAAAVTEALVLAGARSVVKSVLVATEEARS